MLLVANGSVFTRNAQTPFIPNGAVAIDGDTIVEVGPERELKAKYPDAEYVDAQGNLIMPGLINCHTHIYSGLARGLAIKGCNPTNFLENLEQQWWKIDDNLTLDGTKASAYATILDSIRDGVTTIFDHHASFCEIPGSLFTIKDAAQELGMRSCLCYEVSDRRGQEKCDQAIAENAEFAQWAAKERRDNDNHMIAAMFGGHATFTLSDETMDKMAEANNGLTGFHIHVCEGMNDVWDSRLNRGGISPVERLLQHNLLGPDTMLGHCIHVTPAEMDIVKESGTWLVNNPESNMGNAVGCAPVLEFFRRGIPVCMGTDAYTHDMLESLKVFLIIQRHNACHAQRGLVRGHDDAVREQRQDGEQVLRSQARRARGRRCRRRHRYGLQALYAAERGEHRRPHALWHDGQKLPHHHHQRPRPVQGSRVRWALMRTRSTRGPWLSPRSSGARSTIAPTNSQVDSRASGVSPHSTRV